MSWFERKFDFQNLSTTFPIVVERLAGTPGRLEAKVNGISKANLTHRDGESWSIQEQAGHLLDLEPLWLGRVEDLKSGQEVLREADLSNQKTHQAQHNAKNIEGILAAFRAERAKLVSELESLVNQSELVAKHPRLGTPMRLMDLAYFVAEHDDHHLVTIKRLLELLIHP